MALVIGNSHYNPQAAVTDAIIWPDLEQGPARDAEAMAARLRKLNFDVVEVKDANLGEINTALRELSNKIAAKPDSLALFYFSGHGARAPRALGEIGEETYLIPTRTDLSWEGDAYYKAIGLTVVANVLSHSHAGVVILDACRNNALRRTSTRTANARGLASPPKDIGGMLFAYSTAAGDVADNRAGQPSQYTQLLVSTLGKPGEPLVSSFQRVRKQLLLLLESQGHGRAQLPEMTDALNEDIILVPP